MTKKVKSISLNDKNEEEKQMIKHLSRRNFSRYVKGLIREDMKKKVVEKAEDTQVELDIITPVKPLSAKERLAQMKNRSKN